MKPHLLFALLALTAAIHGAVSDDLRGLTGGKNMKIVWLRQTNGNKDIFGWADYRMIAYDTRTGVERDVLGLSQRMWRVILSPDGKLIGYDTQYDTYVVNWDGSGNRKLLGGQMGTFWYDGTRRYAFCFKGDAVVRVDVDNPTDVKTIFSGKVNNSYLSISADGSKLGGEFPRLNHGIVDVASGNFTKYHDDECWPTITTDNTYRFLVFTSNHRKWKVFASPFNVSHELVLNGAPGMDGYEVYHPRFAVNDATIISVTGPYRNGLGGDASMAEVLVGRVSAELRQMEQWVKVTSNSHADFHPSVWVDKGGTGSALGISSPTLALNCTQGSICDNAGSLTVTNAAGTATISQTASWLSVSVEGTGQTQTLKHSVDATGVSAGTYNATVNVTDGSGSVSYTVTAQIQAAAATVAAITISPPNPAIEPGLTLQLSADLTDAAGQPISASATWSVSGGGTITAAGTAAATQHQAAFASDGTAGTFTVSVQAGDKTASVAVVVQEMVTTLTITAPAPGSGYAVGDALTIGWNATGFAHSSTVVELSLDNGDNWIALTKAGGVDPVHDNWGAFVWTVPESILFGGAMVALNGQAALLRLRNYWDETIISELSGPLYLGSLAVSRHIAGIHSGLLSIRVAQNGAYHIIGLSKGQIVEIFDITGKRLTRGEAAPDGVCRFDRLARGRYLVRVY